MIRIALTLFHMHTYYYLRRSFETTLEGSRREWVTIGPATEVTLKLQADAYEVASITIDGTRIYDGRSVDDDIRYNIFDDQETR